MTDTRLTQAAAEHWLTTSPVMQTTQVALEQWASVPVVTVQMLATQIALEHWAQLATAVINGPIVTMIG